MKCPKCGQEMVVKKEDESVNDANGKKYKRTQRNYSRNKTRQKIIY